MRSLKRGYVHSILQAGERVRRLVTASLGHSSLIAEKDTSWTTNRWLDRPSSCKLEEENATRQKDALSRDPRKTAFSFFFPLDLTSLRSRYTQLSNTQNTHDHAHPGDKGNPFFVCWQW